MKNNQMMSSDRLADYYVSYLFKHYSKSLHVRRVASWIGLIVMAISKVADPEIRRVRQLQFTILDRTFKVRYNHKVKSRGGIEIIDVSTSAVVVAIGSLEEAAKFNQESVVIFSRFMKNAV